MKRRIFLILVGLFLVTGCSGHGAAPPNPYLDKFMSDFVVAELVGMGLWFAFMIGFMIYIAYCEISERLAFKKS